ncbi:unnamed protein product [Caenorhabditis brenneri]
MHRNAFRCPAVSVTAAVVGGATLLAVAYYFWSRPKKSCKPSECSSANRSESLESSEDSGGDGRASAGMDTQENMNSFDNENVGGIWKRKEWFMEQMKMGENDGELFSMRLSIFLLIFFQKRLRNRWQEQPKRNLS